MRKILSMVLIFITVIILSSCTNELSNPNCEDGQSFNTETNQCESNEATSDEYNNAIALNTINTDGWTSNVTDFTHTTFDIIDGRIQMIQHESNDSNEMISQTLRYDQLNFDANYVYTLTFQTYGPVGSHFKITLEMENQQFGNETFRLNGAEQFFSMNVYQPIDTNNKGSIIFDFEFLATDSQIIIYNIEIDKTTRSDKTVNVLFVGNSFTYYNDMPVTFEALGEANGYNSLHVEHVTFGGTTLEKFATPSTKQSKAFVTKMKERDWDYVILQEHSSRPYINETSFLNAVSVLTEYIKGKGSKVLLYSTWAYRDGSDKLASTGLTYDEFYQELNNVYDEAANINNIDVVPVGTMFYQLNMTHPEINLLSYSDDFHPNPTGSFVVAFAFYTFIFGQSSNTYEPNGISNQTLNIVRETVRLSLE